MVKGSGTWHFLLRDDVTFHDGTPLTAEDVKASIERIAELNGSAAGLFKPIESIEARGDHELTITTSEPLGTLLINLSRMFIAPAEMMSEPDFFNHSIGSGPFKVESFTVDNQLVLTANDDYWADHPRSAVWTSLIFLRYRAASPP